MVQSYPAQVTNLVLCPSRYSYCLVTFCVSIRYGYIYLNQHLMCFPFPLTIIPMRIDIDPMALLIVPSGIECSVSFTCFAYSSKFSLVMFLLKASACNISFVTLNIFSIGFMSRLRGGMENMALAFFLFWLGILSCKKSFSFGFALFSNMSLKCSKINCANISPLMFLWYCWQSITPPLNAIATSKCATLLPEPTWLPLAVQFKSKTSRFFLQASTCWFCLIERVILVLKTGPIKIESNTLGPTLFLQGFFMWTANTLRALKSFIFKSLFSREW